MPAPKNNSFWKKRTKHGRDKIFATPEDFLASAYEYFEACDENPWFKKEAIKSGDMAGTLIDIPVQKPYSIQGLCIFIGITERTFLNYETEKAYKDFFQVFTHVRDIIENNQMEGATVGAYNANIIARKLGLADNVNQKNTNLGVTKIVAASKEDIKVIEDLQKKFNDE